MSHASSAGAASGANRFGRRVSAMRAAAQAVFRAGGRPVPHHSVPVGGDALSGDRPPVDGSERFPTDSPDTRWTSCRPDAPARRGRCLTRDVYPTLLRAFAITPV